MNTPANWNRSSAGMVTAMTDDAECRMPGCRNPRREDAPDHMSLKFCSDECDVLYYKRRADAREAMLDEKYGEEQR